MWMAPVVHPVRERFRQRREAVWQERQVLQMGTSVRAAVPWFA